MAKKLCRGLLAAMFIGSGFLHFVRPAPFVAIVPPYLPSARALVFISGAFEIFGGVAILVPALRRWAGIGLVLLLLAVYPANIYMATHDVPLGQVHIPMWGHAIRLPLQFVLIAAVIWSAELLRFGPKPIN